MEEAWFYANHDGLKNKYGIGPFSESTYIYYTNKGTVEVWENKASINYLNEELLKCYEQNPNFLHPIIKNYNKNLIKIKKYWKSYPKNISHLKLFVDLVLDMIVDFVVIYQATTDKHVPEKARKEALIWREKDIFFDTCDKTIRQSLKRIYPDKSEFEVTILLDELKNPPSLSVLEKRYKNFVLIPGKIKQIIDLREFAKKNNKYTLIFDEFEVNNNTIKGQTAVKGNVKGVVRILRRKQQINSLKPGEILVSPMTTPDFVTAMKKSGAIITDEGGITCHAAIVAREIGKPCIIGTKFATQILKDGDIVEVDADKGVVRKLKKEINKTDWYHLGKWPQPAVGAETWMTYSNYCQKFFKSKLDGRILFLNGNFFLWQKDVDKIKSESYNAAKSKNLVFFNNIKKEIIRVANSIVKKSKNIKSVSGFLEDYQELTGVWMPLNIVSTGIEKYVNEVSPKSFSLADGSTSETAWTLKQLYEMRKLKKKDYKKHVENYKWKGTHHFTIHEFTLDELKTQIKEDKIVKKKHPKPTYAIKLLDLIGFIRFRCAEASGVSTFNLYPKFASFGKKFGLSYEQITEHTIEEIKNKKISTHTFNKRKKTTGFFFDGKTHLLNDQELNKYTEALLKKDNSNEIRGKTACKGKTIGIVQLVRTKKEMKGFKEGMILVAYETTPDVIIAMKLSGAIVTDFGGLTSHAAIVSREFNIPCIVGTGNATKLLKNGDLVEVDAEKGIVKIL